MKRPVIALASVLKPIDDTRIFEKLGVSLGETKKYDVKIIGFAANKPEHSSQISFFPLPRFKRFSAGRWMASWNILRYLQKIRPDLLIIATPELLPMAIICRLWLRTRIIYDVQENYSLNIITQSVYPLLIRYPLAWGIRLMEYAARPFISWHLLAEKVYVKQLTFPGRRFTVLENKFQGNLPVTPARRGHQRLLFSGTIGPHTGVFRAIELADALHATDSRVTLTIAGFCQHQATREKLMKLVRDKSYIRSIGIDQRVPHAEVLNEIERADAGIITYGDHPSTRGKIPTKLYEYLALQLPIFMEPRPSWLEITRPYQAAVPVNFLNPDGSKLMSEWQNTLFYTSIPGEEVCWTSEENKFLEMINNVL
jgi:glycosyltransferase involved in cell wall biosynthesis